MPSPSQTFSWLPSSWKLGLLLLSVSAIVCQDTTGLLICCISLQTAGGYKPVAWHSAKGYLSLAESWQLFLLYRHNKIVVECYFIDFYPLRTISAMYNSCQLIFSKLLSPENYFCIVSSCQLLTSIPWELFLHCTIPVSWYLVNFCPLRTISAMYNFCQLVFSKLLSP